MKLSVRRLSAALPLFVMTLSVPAPVAAASISVSGVFSAPILDVVQVINTATGVIDIDNNTATAVTTGFGTNSVTWGTPGTGGAVNAVQFAGNAITANPGDIFQLGTLTYSNGSILVPSGIGGFTLTLNATVDGVPVLASVSLVEAIATLNLGPAACGGLPNGQCPDNADFLSFGGLGTPPPLSFNVFEEATATAILFGQIQGGSLVLTGLGIAPGSGGSAFIGNGVNDYVVPEPSTLILLGSGLAIAVGRGLRRRKN